MVARCGPTTTTTTTASQMNFLKLLLAMPPVFEVGM
jgi:hypothetical protein